MSKRTILGMVILLVLAVSLFLAAMSSSSGPVRSGAILFEGYSVSNGVRMAHLVVTNTGSRAFIVPINNRGFPVLHNNPFPSNVVFHLQVGKRINGYGDHVVGAPLNRIDNVMKSGQCIHFRIPINEDKNSWRVSLWVESSSSKMELLKMWVQERIFHRSVPARFDIYSAWCNEKGEITPPIESIVPR